MIYLLSTLFIKLSNDKTYSGKGIATNYSKMQYEALKQTNFLLVLSENESSYFGDPVFKCSLELLFDDSFEEKEKIEMFGLYLKNQSNYFFFRDYLHNDLNSSIRYLYSLPKIYQKENFIDALNELYARKDAHLYLILNSTVRDPVPSSFLLGEHISGVFLSHNFTFLNIEGDMFDVLSYISEGRSFGVVLSICIITNMYAWLTITVKYLSKSQLSQFSEHSLLLHIGYDFCMIFFVLDVSFSSEYFLRLYLLLFLALIIIYLALQMKALVMVWRSNRSENYTADEIQELLFVFFLEVSFVSALSSVSSVVFSFPFPAVFIIYSSYIPQIVHSLKNPRTMKRNQTFYIITYLVKLVPLFYFTLYPKNIKKVHSKLIGILVFVYYSIQFLLVFLQDRLGGDFFLPKSMRQKTHNYRERRDWEINECAICMCQMTLDDITMTPPCGHTFHRDCLQRWMNEELICPVCRSPLPAET